MKYYEQALRKINRPGRPSKSQPMQLSIYDLTNASKAILFFHIQILMLIYFNDVKVSPDKAFSKDIDLIRETIAEYQDYLENSKNFSDKVIMEIYFKYLKKRNFSIPYLNKTIKDNEFIDLFERMHKSIYKCQTIMKELVDKDDMDKEINELEDFSEEEKKTIMNKYKNKRGRYATSIHTKAKNLLSLNEADLSR